MLACKRNGIFKKVSSKKCRSEPKGRNSRDVKKRRHWDDARAGSKTRNKQEIQGNKRGQRVKQTRQIKEKALPHLLLLRDKVRAREEGSRG